MTSEQLKDEIIEIQTIQLALNDKLHRIEALIGRTQKRIDKIEKETEQ